MNMYDYVGNDPVNQIDPSGVEGCPSGSASSGAFRCGGGISEQEEDAGTNRLLLRVGQLLVYDAILHLLTSSEARSLPVQFASYAEERIVNFGPSHAATRELASSLYVRQFTD